MSPYLLAGAWTLAAAVALGFHLYGLQESILDGLAVAAKGRTDLNEAIRISVRTEGVRGIMALLMVTVGVGSLLNLQGVGLALLPLPFLTAASSFWDFRSRRKILRQAKASRTGGA